MLRLAYLAFISAFVVLLAGCVGNEGRLVPKGEAPVTLNSGEKRTQHGAKVANTVKITFPPCDAGSVWKVVQADTRFVQVLGESPPAKTAGETLSISVLALRQGVTRLRFVCVPADAGREATPSDFHDVILRIE